MSSRSSAIVQHCFHKSRYLLQHGDACPVEVQRITFTCRYCIYIFTLTHIALQTVCVDRCVGKHVSVNHKIMSVYSEVQPIYMQRRIDEMTQQMEAQQQQEQQQ